MKQPHAQPIWTTASFGGTADTSPMELDALGDHLSTCRSQQGRFLAMHCAAERLHGYVATRLVTSLVVAVPVLFGIGLLVARGGVM